MSINLCLPCSQLPKGKGLTALIQHGKLTFFPATENEKIVSNYKECFLRKSTKTGGPTALFCCLLDTGIPHCLHLGLGPCQLIVSRTFYNILIANEWLMKLSCLDICFDHVMKLAAITQCRVIHWVSCGYY